ncbi:MAG: RdgB/HAM1 family non-canonical purine NTP pyrophosphatase [Bacteroidota bacterium]
MQLLFATHNQNKVNELRKKVPSSIDLISLQDINFNEEIEETGTTIEANALLKAQFIFEKFKKPCIADDTGLEVEALNGEPGVYSARYAGSDKSDVANMQKLLQNLDSKANRNARFKSVIAYCDGNSTFIFEGIISGKIGFKQIGTNGFGYDPIFIPDGFNKTFAQMSMDEKNTISHRAIAVTKFLDFIAKTQ